MNSKQPSAPVRNFISIIRPDVRTPSHAIQAFCALSCKLSLQSDMGHDVSLLYTHLQPFALCVILVQYSYLIAYDKRSDAFGSRGDPDMNWPSRKVHRACRRRYPESATHASHDLKLCGASILREVAVSRCSSCTTIREHRTIAFRILLMALRRTALFGALGPVALDSSALRWGKPVLLVAGCTASQSL